MMSDHGEMLKNILINNIPNAKVVSGGRFVLTKCVFCDDGKHHDSMHLYINVECNGEVPWCYCHICKTSAWVTSNFLSSNFGIYDVDFLIRHNKYFKKIRKSGAGIRRKSFSQVKYSISNNFISDNELSEVKLKYINNRLGTNLIYEDLMNDKIVLNLYDLLNSNNIKSITRHINVIDELDRSFIGFISSDNASINFRNLRPKSLNPPLNKRYIKYAIFDDNNSGSGFYMLPNSIIITKPERIKIHIAEGPFDILSIYHNLRKTRNHNIYAAVNGSNYINLVKHFINILQLMYIEIHLYIDSEIDMYTVNEIAKYLRPFGTPFYLHSNSMEGEKDFGVPLDRIIESVERIL